MIDIRTINRWCAHCRDHTNPDTHASKCEFARLQQINDMLVQQLAKQSSYWISIVTQLENELRAKS
jgi:hypothetical protein